MQVTLTVYYTDGTSGTCTFEKPPGAHPKSVLCAKAGMEVAEQQTGKTVEKIGVASVNPFSKPGEPLIIDDENLIERSVLVKDKWPSKLPYFF